MVASDHLVRFRFPRGSPGKKGSSDGNLSSTAAAAEKDKEKVSNTRDKLAFQQVVDFVNSNKKREETVTKHK